jgi:hypothetical protein
MTPKNKTANSFSFPIHMQNQNKLWIIKIFYDLIRPLVPACSADLSSVRSDLVQRWSVSWRRSAARELASRAQLIRHGVEKSNHFSMLNGAF